jgi:hypothetical protein
MKSNGAWHATDAFGRTIACAFDCTINDAPERVPEGKAEAVFKIQVKKP